METCSKNYYTKSIKPEQMQNLYLCLKISSKQNIQQFAIWRAKYSNSPNLLDAKTNDYS